ncbi:NAD(P)-binding Rossmann-fold containing protein [Glarea lozoyensis ATCC 20868]|uniref:NAD(P)-binding Rossmann-fold containing protein n=1 Tax=Glarea lozoyensis (strain ATCC 20868 / MF5171) TaxID=1116229 RepID=S3DRF2_GLAL2|nr:NAD(P)-binding Rossmann-fold containing protein [Glarea lozoyensis ATCC 20868]EPE29053.1 NAD(P)-binding Rossmann-fold containing protein [Glarea lozoyensis ATCC 20868]
MSEFHEGCVAFVTGAASGIGLATARHLVSVGITKIALLDLSSDSLNNLPTALTQLSPKTEVLILPTDVSQEQEVEAAVKQTVDRFGRIDIAFLAAGISGSMEAFETSEVEALDKVLGVNLRGVWLCERAVVKVMLGQEERGLTTGLPYKTRGSIVNVGSVCSHITMVPNLTPYVMAKHGLLGLTRSTAMDLGPKGVRVNCVSPGWIKTAMTKEGHENKEASDASCARVPMGRWGSPEEVAYLATFLLSDKASYLTGGSYEVDGGMLCA